MDSACLTAFTSAMPRVVKDQRAKLSRTELAQLAMATEWLTRQIKLRVETMDSQVCAGCGSRRKQVAGRRQRAGAEGTEVLS